MKLPENDIWFFQFTALFLLMPLHATSQGNRMDVLQANDGSNVRPTEEIEREGNVDC